MKKREKGCKGNKPRSPQPTGNCGPNGPYPNLNNSFIVSQHLLPILLILIVSASIYANTLINGFVYDDEYTIIENSLIKDIANLHTLFNKDYFKLSGEATYRPIVTLTYFMDYALYGLKPWGYHLTNSILHAFNGVLLYIFLTLLAFSWTECNPRPILPRLFSNLPLLISLLFVTHPILTEAVNAVSYREDLLASLFYILTLCLYIVIKTNSFPSISSIATRSLVTKIYFFSCLSYLLSLLSKEMAVTLPLIIYCYDWICRDKKQGSKYLLNPYNIGYIIITLTYIYLFLYQFHNPLEESNVAIKITERMLTLPYILLNYLKLALFPIALSADYDINPVKYFFKSSFIIPFVILCFIFATISRVAKGKDPRRAFGILFFFITLLPVSNIYPIPNPFAERYLYIPMVGLAIALVAISNCLIANSTKTLHYFTAALFLAVLCIYSFATIKRSNVWRDDYSLWSDTIKKMPTSGRARSNLGYAYIKNELLDKALPELQAAAQIRPQNAYIHNNLGLIYARQGMIDKAFSEFQLAVKFKPDFVNAYINLGLMYTSLGLKEKAKSEFEKALRLKPNDPEIIEEIKSLE